MAYLESKPRYEILDGLRGVAAILVASFHIFELYATSSADKIINHGYLAVDFFFLLSGYVTGYAYDDRLASGKLTVRDFFKRRITRLQPMLVMGITIGTLLFYFSVSPTASIPPLWQVLLIAFAALFLVTLAPCFAIKSGFEPYPLNGPVWSLACEYIGNILYALVVRHFSKTMLAVFVGLCAFLTIDLGMNIDLFGLLKKCNYEAYSLNGGWLYIPSHLYIAMVRLFCSFFMGLLLARLGKKISLRGGLIWCALLLVMFIAAPRIGSGEFSWANGLYETLVVLVAFPLIVVAGAGSHVRAARSLALCKWLGAISYPLYLIHDPLVYVLASWKRSHPDAPLAVHIFMIISTFVLAVAVAYASLKLYDQPVRKWLRQHWLAKN